MVNAIMEDYQALGRREEESVRLRVEAEELVRAARAGAEQHEKNKAAFEKHKLIEEWAATAELKQELINAMAANAALGKEKAAAEAVAVNAREAEAWLAKALEEAKEAGARAAKALEEAKEREGRVSKALEEANADRDHLNQIVASLQAEVQTRENKLAEVTTRATVAEKRASEIVKAILNAPETSGFRDVNTEALLEAACASFYDTSIAALEELDKCLDAPDYVDRLRMLYANVDDSDEEEVAGDAKGGAGTSGTK
ncbi:uncharacterized protein LOC110924236 [Helianthus annuus]|uniref:uncharacterized protein LOC110924236 n=1 Tax=Helianthus annuus TaxID=4232 RepID=UPI000B900506|nr:uncharacterized protein LOC110924236 [Helianthus annuus]